MNTLDKEFTLQAKHAARRVDQVLCELLPDFSRSYLQSCLDKGQVLLNGEKVKRSQKVKGFESLQVRLEEQTAHEVIAQDIPLDIVYRDDALIVVNKPAGLVVHPAAGNPDGTLQNALLHHFPDLESLPRAGIVHRLDKDTTGLMVVAANRKSHAALVNALQLREVKRQYFALAKGELGEEGDIDQPVGRHPRDRKKMAVVAGGKPAVTHYAIAAQYPYVTALDVQLETGRTHQIRVHMNWLGYPLVGDPVYGAKRRWPIHMPATLKEILDAFPRQALHARALGFTHPNDGREMMFKVPLPEDLGLLLQQIEAEDELV